MSKKTYPQERPSFCPHFTCEFRQRVIDSMCVGQLPKPEPHDGDLNTHRLCLNGADEGGGVFDLQINRSDVGWFRWLFDSVFPLLTTDDLERGAEAVADQKQGDDGN